MASKNENENKEGTGPNNEKSRPLSPLSDKLSTIREKLRSPRSRDTDDSEENASASTSGGSGGSSARWHHLMKKLDFESKGIKKKLQRLSHSSQRTTLQQILSELTPEAEKKNALLELQLKTFATRHQSHHRPIALVTSGGTATDLEVRAVRYLDNFSTGQRGAVSVEEFLKRGYAVIHLWREGSAAPYSRVMSQMMGTKQANHALNFEALGKLFEGQLPEGEDEKDGEGNNGDRAGSMGDPWLTSTQKRPTASNSTSTESSEKFKKPSAYSDDEDGTFSTAASSMNRMNLTKRMLNSTKLQIKLRERANVIKEGLLLTIPFRTVEEYLIRLKLCSEAIHDCQSLGLIYLAAAVSDFYIPRADKAEHKIQSRDYDIEKIGLKKPKPSGSASAIYIDKETNCLHLKLSPVPKVISLIREDFAPNAFCVSFKLETDKNILVEKAKIAIRNYDMHMVIGNVLETRYEKVWILQNRGIFISEDETNDSKSPEGTGKVVVDEVSRTDASLSSLDELEDAMVSHVIEKHFEYIANHYLVDDDNSDGSKDVMPSTALMAGAEAAARHNAYLREKKRILQNELYWKRVRDVTLNIAGYALGTYITILANRALQRRIRM